MQNLEETQRIASEATRYYVRRVPWAREHVADMMQEAVLAALLARRTYRPALGAWRPYAARVIFKTLKRYLWKNRAPVEPPMDYHRSGGHHQTVPVSTLRDTIGIPCERQWADELLDNHRLRARTKKILTRLDRTQDRPKLCFALAVQEGYDAKGLAMEAGVAVSRVHMATYNVSRLVAKSFAAKNLWAEVLP